MIYFSIDELVRDEDGMPRWYATGQISETRKDAELKLLGFQNLFETQTFQVRLMTQEEFYNEKTI